MTRKRVHYNKTQLRASLIDCQTEVHIVGRGEGKTEGILATKTAKLARLMPKGVTILATPTYEGLLTKTLPPLVRGLDRLGIYKDYHYVIGKQAPKSWGWEDPFHKAIRSEYVMHFCTGHCLFFASFNRENSVNGISGHAVITDEAKFFVREKKERFNEELTPAIRGQKEYFGNLSQYRSFTFTTDQPTHVDAKWLFDYKDRMDPDVIEIIEGLQFEILTNKSKLKQKPSSGYLINKIKRLEYELNEFRKGEVFYHEPAGLENFELLGEEAYLQWKRDLPDFVFRTSILNERVLKVEDGFYPLLDDEHHGYWSVDSKLEDLAHNTNFDVDQLNANNSLHDSDILQNSPLDIALDWGDHINCLVIGQRQGHRFNFLNSLFVKKPKKIQDLANEFCSYYRFHKTKKVFLPYDHTAYAGHGATTSTYLSEFTKVLRDHGWTVEMTNIGQTSTHEFRYLLWHTLLSETDKRFPSIRFNRRNCEYLLISLNHAPAKQGSKRFEKDKSAERKRDSVPQEEATHFSDAADTLMVFRFGQQLQDRPRIEGNVYG